MRPLAKSILETLAFFDAQERPLTLLEIKNYLPDAGARLSEILRVLETELNQKVACENGFYFLKGSEHAVEMRHKRYRISLQRFRKARRFLRAVKHIPFIRAVAISGSQALLNSDEKSDIDLFILTKTGRIWLARVLVSFYFQIMGQRRYKKFTRNRFCLNHYLSEKGVIVSDRNEYTAVEYASLIPALGSGRMENFWRRSQWIAARLPNAEFETDSVWFDDRPSRWQKLGETFLEALFLAPLLEKILAWYQRNRIVRQDHVFFTEDELSFHPESKGQRILGRFREKMARLGT